MRCSCSDLNCINMNADHRTSFFRFPKDKDDGCDLQSKPISIQLMQSDMSGIVKESPFSTVKLPTQEDIRESELCLAHKESQKIVTEQKGESYFLDSLHSLPKALVLRQSSLHRKYYGIWSKENIPEGTRFGPYSGILINDTNEQQITEVKNKSERDEIPSNWLAYINHAFRKEQQNLIAFQFQGQMFYISCVNIPANTELLAGYKCEHGSVNTSIEDHNKPELCKVLQSCQKSYKYNDCDNFSMQHYLKKDIPDNKIRNYSTQGMTHTKRMPDEYTICQKKVIQVISLQRHQMLRIAKKYICDKCGKTFEQQLELKRHKSLHVRVKPYICDVCGKTFTHNYNLKIHRRRAHTGEKPYECDKCEKKFADSADLKKHLKRIHTDERPYGCDECEKKYALSVDLKFHKRIHVKEKPFDCDICGKKFTHNKLLSRHKIRLHTVKLYECDVCGKKFAVVTDLNKHKKIHFTRATYKCDDCGKQYALLSSLTRHKKHHIIGKAFKCDLCMKGFTEKVLLVRHKMRYTGQKPYECDYCGKKFLQRCGLKTHTYFHTGKKSLTNVITVANNLQKNGSCKVIK